MKPLSFRARIAGLSALISGVVLIGFCCASWYWIRRQSIEAVDTEIRSLGARHPGWFANRGGFDRLSSALEFIFGPEHAEQVILMVKDPGGGVLYTSPGWPTEIDPDRLDCRLADNPRGAVELGPGGGTAGRWAAGGGRGPATRRPVFVSPPPNWRFTPGTLCSR